MHKIKPGTLTAGTVKSNFKKTIERFVARNDAFSFMSSVKGTPAYWKQFSYDVLAMVKQLETSKYFLTLSCARDRNNGQLSVKTNQKKITNLKILRFKQINQLTFST